MRPVSGGFVRNDDSEDKKNRRRESEFDIMKAIEDLVDSEDEKKPKIDEIEKAANNFHFARDSEDEEEERNRARYRKEIPEVRTVKVVQGKGELMVVDAEDDRTADQIFRDRARRQRKAKGVANVPEKKPKRWLGGWGEKEKLDRRRKQDKEVKNMMHNVVRDDDFLEGQFGGMDIRGSKPSRRKASGNRSPRKIPKKGKNQKARPVGNRIDLSEGDSYAKKLGLGAGIGAGLGVGEMVSGGISGAGRYRSKLQDPYADGDNEKSALTIQEQIEKKKKSLTEFFSMKRTKNIKPKNDLTDLEDLEITITE